MAEMRTHHADCQAAKLANRARVVIDTIAAYGITDPQVTSILAFIVQWTEALHPVEIDARMGWKVQITSPDSTHRRLEFYHDYRRTYTAVNTLLFGQEAKSAVHHLVINCCSDT